MTSPTMNAADFVTKWRENARRERASSQGRVPEPRTDHVSQGEASGRPQVEGEAHERLVLRTYELRARVATELKPRPSCRRGDCSQ